MLLPYMEMLYRSDDGTVDVCFHLMYLCLVNLSPCAQLCVGTSSSCCEIRRHLLLLAHCSNCMGARK